MQAIETKKRVLGEEHPSTLTSMNNPGIDVLEIRAVEGG
jgi:hypothetical protein